MYLNLNIFCILFLTCSENFKSHIEQTSITTLFQSATVRKNYGKEVLIVTKNEQLWMYSSGTEEKFTWSTS